MSKVPDLTSDGRTLAILDTFKVRVTSATGWRRNAWAFGAGALSVFAFAPFHASPVLFITLPVFVWLIDGAVAVRGDRIANRRLFAGGWWFGFGFFLFGLIWISEAFLVEAEKYALLIPFAVTLLPAGLAFFFAAAALAAGSLWPAGAARVLVLAVALAATEWLRGNILTGLPWNALGYALAYPLVLMQTASIFGTYGLALWVVLIGAAPLVIATDARNDSRSSALATGLAVALIPLAAFAIYGWLRLAPGPASNVEGVKLRIVQPSVPQREKWKPENQGPIFRDHIDLSRRNAEGRVDDLAGVTHVVWPEAAMPFLPLDHPEAIAAIGEMLPANTYLVSGALRLAEPASARRVFNTMLVFGHSGGLAAMYDKTHLVPFGEYLPLPSLWRAFGLKGLVEMRGAFEAGPEPRPLLDIPGLPKAGALICYESIFPGRVLQGSERPGVLLNITNDGWFGNSTGPRQHFHQAQVRAVEEGLPLVRSANNGISAVIDAEGRVIQRLDLNVRGVIDADLPSARPPPLYARWGDLVFLLNAALFAALAGYLARRHHELSPEVDAGDCRTYEL